MPALAALRRIGVLMTGTPASHGVYLEALRKGLRDAGLVEGTGIALEIRWMQGDQSRAHALLGELIERRVELLVVQGISVAVEARALTRSLPVVVTVMANPVGAGVAQSLAKPGGNVTGITNVPQEIIGKGVELLAALQPRIKRVAMLFDPTWPANAEYQRGFAAAIERLRFLPVLLPAKNREEVARLPAELSHERPDALLVTTNIVNNTFRKQILSAVAAAGMVAVYPLREWALDGGLVSYGSSNVQNARRAAYFVQRILDGQSPGDLPIEQSRLELVVNLATARAQGIAIPREVLVRADEVIE